MEACHRDGSDWLWGVWGRQRPATVQAEGLSAERVFLMTFYLRLLLRAGHMCDSHVWVSKNSLCLGLVLM